MAHPSTLYRFRLQISDMDRGCYDALDFRVAMHPSESPHFLLTRVLAFALNWQDGLEFTPGGLSDPDEPAIRVPDPNGSPKLWIEIGNPSARKLHKAAKASPKVMVYTYKDADLLLKEMASADVYHAERIGIFALAPAFLNQLATWLGRDNSWSVMHDDGSLMVSQGEQSASIEIQRFGGTTV